MKKFLGIFIFVSVLFVGVQSAKASTLDDLYAQINALTQQVSELKSQISAAVLRTTNPDCTATTAPWIKVLSPNGGESYVKGSSVDVRWSTCNIPRTGKIRINVDQIIGTANAGVGIIDTTNDGVETITLPSPVYVNATTPVFPGMIYGNNFKMLVAWMDATTQAGVLDFSDNFFIIKVYSDPNPTIPVNPTTETTPTSFESLPTSPAQEVSPRIMYWQGGVNQHVDLVSGRWVTDKDGVSGAEIDKLQYCKKWYPNTTDVREYKTETIDTWWTRGNATRKTPSTKMSYSCVQQEGVLPTVNPTIVTLSRDVKIGETSDEVKKLQEFLASSGYLTKDNVIGVYGNKTVTAVKAWQRANGLGADGKIGPKTREFLRRGSSKKVGGMPPSCTSNSISVVVDPSQPVSQMVPAGTNNFKWSSIKVSSNCDISVDSLRFEARRLPVGGAVIPASYFKNMTVYSGGVNVGNNTNMHSDGFYYVKTPNLIIKAGNSVTLDVHADIDSSVPTGTQAAISFSSTLYATDMMTLPPSPFNYNSQYATWGNTMTIGATGCMVLVKTSSTNPASQNVAVGTNNFKFASIEFLASGCQTAVTLDQIEIDISGLVTPNVSTSINNVVVKNNGNAQIYSTIGNPSAKQTIVINPGLIIQNYHIGQILDFYADVVGGSGKTVKFGTSVNAATDLSTGMSANISALTTYGSLMTIQ